MSISLVGVMVGLPIALAMRGIMGKEKFDQWLAETDYILVTNFSGEDEMKTVVKRAGYDVTEWVGSLKTHLTEERSSFFWWEKENNKILAKMSILDDKEEIEKFIKKVERTAGRKIFFERSDNQKQKVPEVVMEKRIEKEQETTSEQQDNEKYRETFPSVYTDRQLIVTILERYQIPVILVEEHQIVAEYENYELTFVRESEDEAFDIRIVSDSKKMKNLYSCLECLTEEYYASVQERTYTHICEQLEEEGLVIEEEQIMEDNTIVLTVQV